MKPIFPVQPRPYARVYATLAVLVGASIVWAAFELGQMRAGHNRLAAMQRDADLRAELEAQRRSNLQLNSKIALLETDAKVKAEAYKTVEQQLVGLQGKIQQQSEELAFYEGIVGDQTRGLRVQDFGLFPGAGPEEFSLRLVLAQELRSGKRVSGTVEVSVAGERDGQSAVMALGDLVVDGPGRLDFSFRYFQNLEADLRVPSDFAPQVVTVRVRPRGKGAEPVEASFQWELRRG